MGSSPALSIGLLVQWLRYSPVTGMALVRFQYRPSFENLKQPKGITMEEQKNWDETKKNWDETQEYTIKEKDIYGIVAVCLSRFMISAMSQNVDLLSPVSIVDEIKKGLKK